MRNNFLIRLCEFRTVIMCVNIYFTSRNSETAGPTGTSTAVSSIVVHVYDEAKKSKLSQ